MAWRRYLFPGGKVLLSVGVVSYLWTMVGTERLMGAFSQMSAGYMGGAAGLLVATYLLGAWRWRLLLGAFHSVPGFWRLFPGYYFGMLCNQVLPSGIAGDAVRTMWLRYRGLALEPLVASAITERVIGLLVVLLMCLVLWFVGDGSDRLPSAVGLLLVTGTVVMVGVLSIFSRERYFRMAQSMAGRRLGKRGGAGVLAIWRLCQRYMSRYRLVLPVSLATIVTVLLNAAAYFILARGLGDHSPFSVYMLAVPLAMLAANIPVSLGGLGVREGVLVATLVAAGLDASLAVSLSFVYLVLLWGTTLPALAVLWGDRIRGRKVPEIDRRPFR